MRVCIVVSLLRSFCIKGSPEKMGKWRVRVSGEGFCRLFGCGRKYTFAVYLFFKILFLNNIIRRLVHLRWFN